MTRWKPLKTMGLVISAFALVIVITFSLGAESLGAFTLVCLIISSISIWRYINETPPSNKEQEIHRLYISENAFAQKAIRKALFISKISSDLSFVILWWLIVAEEGYREFPQFIYHLIDKDAVYSLNTHPYIFGILIYALMRIPFKLIAIELIKRTSASEDKDAVSRFLQLRSPSPSFIHIKPAIIITAIFLLFMTVLTLGCRVRVSSDGIGRTGVFVSHKGWVQVESITGMRTKFSLYPNRTFWRVRFTDESHWDIPYDGCRAAEYIALRSREYIDYRAKMKNRGSVVKSAPAR